MPQWTTRDEESAPGIFGPYVWEGDLERVVRHADGSSHIELRRSRQGGWIPGGGISDIVRGRLAEPEDLERFGLPAQEIEAYRRWYRAKVEKA